MQSTQQFGDGRQRCVRLTPVGIRRDRDVALQELETLPSVIVDADWHGYPAKTFRPDGPQPGMDRGRVRTRRTKNMATGANHRPCVRYPSFERLLVHIATLADDSDEPTGSDLDDVAVGIANVGVWHAGRVLALLHEHPTGGLDDGDGIIE